MAAGLTGRDLVGLGSWCAYQSAIHGTNQCFPDDYRGLTGEQRETVKDAQDAAIEAITATLTDKFGADWLDAIKRIEHAALDKESDQ